MCTVASKDITTGDFEWGSRSWRTGASKGDETYLETLGKMISHSTRNLGFEFK